MENPVNQLPHAAQKAAVKSLPHKLGASVESGRTEFCVWAPFAEQVDAHLLENRSHLALARSGEYFTAIVDSDLTGCRFRYRIDGGDEYPDPASRWQPDGVHGPSAILPQIFEWSDHAWHGLDLKDYIFYELHVGTFSVKGTFDGVKERLEELRDLGITAIELMPVVEFPGSRNWGYDGVYPFAVHHAYGGAVELKRLIDACHGFGMAVVLDVVYNHLGPEGNYLGKFGPYFTDRYRTPWGPAINFDGEHSDHVVRYFVENAIQWLDEFHVDALRLDAIHGIIDQSAQPFLACLSEAVDHLAERQGRKIYLIAESDLNDTRVLRTRSEGGYGLHAQWNDDFHHALHAVQTGERDGYYQDFGSVADLAKSFHEGFVYEGQYSKFRKQRHGNSSAAVPASSLVVCSQNHDQVGNRMRGGRSPSLLSFEALKLSAAVVLLSPFLPLIFMGEEFAEKNPFLYFTSHGDAELAEAVRKGRRAEFAAFASQGEAPDPQAEATFHSCRIHALGQFTPEQKTMRRFYRELIALRRKLANLLDCEKKSAVAFSSESPRFLAVKRGQGADEVFLLFNFEKDPVSPPASLLHREMRCLLDSADVGWGGPGASFQDMIKPETFAKHKIAPQSACVLGRAA